MTIVTMLHDTHVLVLMSDPRASKTLTRIFQEMGATVHTAATQNEAIGLYWRLFRAGTRPRVVVSSWSLTPQDSKEYKYLEMIGREKIDGTALNLLVNIVDLDPTAFLVIYTEDSALAKETLTECSIAAEVVNRNEVGLVDFVVRVATHPGICTQRISKEEVDTEIHSREKMRRMTTRSSADLPAVHFG